MKIDNKNKLEWLSPKPDQLKSVKKLSNSLFKTLYLKSKISSANNNLLRICGHKILSIIIQQHVLNIDLTNIKLKTNELNDYFINIGAQPTNSIMLLN